MTAPDPFTVCESLQAQLRYVPLILTGALDGYRISFGGGETVCDFKSLQVGGEALRQAEFLTDQWLRRVGR